MNGQLYFIYSPVHIDDLWNDRRLLYFFLIKIWRTKKMDTIRVKQFDLIHVHSIYWVIFPTTLFSEFKLNNYHNACYTVPCTMLVVCTFSLARARHHSWWMEGEFRRRSRWNGNCTELPRLPLYLILTAFAPEGVLIVPGSKSRWTALLNRLMTS